MPQRFAAYEAALELDRASGTASPDGRAPRCADSAPRRTPAATRGPVLIGSPPGAGSTLLSVILDAHPEIACGPELTIFSHPLLYSNFARFRRAVHLEEHLRWPWRDSYRALRRGFAPYSGISNQNAPYYGIGGRDFLVRLQSHDDVRAWLAATFGPWLAARCKTVFVEKSPENIYGMDAFLDAFPAGSQSVSSATRSIRFSACGDAIFRSAARCRSGSSKRRFACSAPKIRAFIWSARRTWSATPHSRWTALEFPASTTCLIDIGKIRPESLPTKRSR
jgi:hypothetical protein